jgi:nucleoside-diphosphate-sugar epimerase
MLIHHSDPASRPARVAIVGANGFVGRSLSASLAACGTTVIPLGRPDFDLLDPECVGRLAASWEPADTVIVTAALTPDKGRDAATYQKNMSMGEHLAAAIAARPCAHLVYFSSDAVYDAAQPVLNEAAPTAPADLYGAMHLAREQMFREAAARAAIPFCVLRPCAIYGAGDTHNSYGPNRFIRCALAEGRIKLFGAGEETRDHVYVDDVSGLTRLVLLGRSAGTLNLVSGQAVSFRWLASEIAGLSGRPVALEQLPRSGAVTHRSFDARSIASAFPGYKPTLPAEGMRLAMAAFQAAGVRI